MNTNKISSAEQIQAEVLRCRHSPIYFASQYCQIYDATEGDWIPFSLWTAQARTLKSLQTEKLIVILKARQLGMTWLVLAYALWLMLFHPAATVLLFSRRDDEAIHLLDDRLKGMYKRLPEWLKCRSIVTDNEHEWGLSNGSVGRAFPTTAGDSYTASLAIVDEADLVSDLGRLMRSVKPTIDNGGQMILLSRADKYRPESEFKRMYQAAKARRSSWHAIFLPWHVHPARDDLWYEQQRNDSLVNTGSLDDVHEQYPATDVEALSPRTLDKRIPAAWLLNCYTETGVQSEGPAINGLAVYRAREPGGLYVIGADPAEGNPTSDDSAATVLDKHTGEEVASLAGKFEPSTFAAHLDALGTYYNRAAVMVERNNHGHAVLLWLKEHSRLYLLRGHDKKIGWNSSTLGKTLLYTTTADSFRSAEVHLHNFTTYNQLSSVEGSSLRAPEGQHDDRADSFALAVVALHSTINKVQIL